jgi:hypothetical protein
VLSDVWVREREQILDRELKLSLHVLFLLAFQGSVHSFLSVSHMYAHTHTIFSLVLSKQEGSVEAIVWHGCLASQICTYNKIISFSDFRPHVDIWEGLFHEIDARVDAHR